MWEMMCIVTVPSCVGCDRDIRVDGLLPPCRRGPYPRKEQTNQREGAWITSDRTPFWPWTSCPNALLTSGPLREDFVTKSLSCVWLFATPWTTAHQAPLSSIVSWLLFSHSVVSNSLQPHGLQHARLPVLHHLLEFAQTHIHWVSDAI